MLLRRPARLRGVSSYTVSSEKLSDTSGVESGDHHTTRYQKISSRTTSLRSPVVITKEDLSSGGSSLSSNAVGATATGGTSSTGTLKKPAPSPRLETRTIVTRTESTTSPSGDKVVRTETTVATPEKTEVKTTETTVVDGRTEVKESTQLKPADPHLASYSEYQAPRVEALYATIQKKKEDTPPKVEEKNFDSKDNADVDTQPKAKDSNSSATASSTVQESNRTSETIIHEVEPGKRDTLKKIGETTKEKTEVKVEEKTTIIATTTSTVANGDVKRNGSIKKESDAKLPLNIQESPAEESKPTDSQSTIRLAHVKDWKV